MPDPKTIAAAEEVLRLVEALAGDLCVDVERRHMSACPQRIGDRRLWCRPCRARLALESAPRAVLAAGTDAGPVADATVIEEVREALRSAVFELDNYVADASAYEAPDGLPELKATTESARTALAKLDALRAGKAGGEVLQTVRTGTVESVDFEGAIIEGDGLSVALHWPDAPHAGSRVEVIVRALDGAGKEDGNGNL